MLRCPTKLSRLGIPSWSPSPPDSGDMSGDVNMGGLSGFIVCPDMAGLWYGLTPCCEPDRGDFSRMDRGESAAGDRGGDRGFTFRYREGGRRGEGLLSGTMNRS